MSDEKDSASVGDEALNAEQNQASEASEAVDQDLASDDSAPESASEIDPHARIDELELALAAAKESVLRAQADAINSQRRAEKEVEKARKFALEGFSREVLVVADNLERALSVVDQTDQSLQPIVEGIELTLKSFSDVLAKYNIEAVEPMGEPFDPQLHQAMSMVPNPEVEPNTVIAVMQKGYTLNGRLIRPAMVIVSKAD
jgi:molecular chaperone GrpE